MRGVCVCPDHKDRIYLVARDVGNPSWRDPHFPVVRHQDIYNGFSWASGLGPGERQEESASEVSFARDWCQEAGTRPVVGGYS